MKEVTKNLEQAKRTIEKEIKKLEKNLEAQLAW
jgi:predicted DNA-binding transcriptional regulator